MPQSLQRVHDFARTAFILTAWPLIVANAAAIILAAIAR